MSSEELQFDRAEFAAPPANALTCQSCRTPLAATYFEVGGQPVCERCRFTLEAAAREGPGARGFLRALAAGTGAALAGFLLYYGVSALTGYEFGLIAIVVGFLVGGAVRWGSHRRGGWLYQALAVGLTYLSIASTYLPPIVKEFRTRASQNAEVAKPAAPAVATPPANAEAAQADKAMTPGEFAIGIGALLLIAVAAPFLAGFENLLGLLIIGFGLYEAWKLNKRSVLEITGPHALP